MRYFNGSEKEHSCSDINGQLCDFCLQSEEHVDQRKRQQEIVDHENDTSHIARKKQRRSEAIVDRKVSNAQHWQYLNGLVDETLDESKSPKCCVCWLKKNSYNHSLKECEYWKSINGFEGLNRVSIELDYRKVENKSTCWTCGFPADQCSHYRLIGTIVIKEKN